jgi:hypothetical protein
MNYFKREKVKVKVFTFDDNTHNAMAYDGKYGIANCYGTTAEKAKEMALLKLTQCYENENIPKEMNKLIKYNREKGKWEGF